MFKIKTGCYCLFVLLITSYCSQNGDDIRPGNEPDYDFPEGKIFLSYPPLPLEGIRAIEPRGWLDPPPSPHGAFHHKEFFVDDATTPVLAAADGLVITLIHNGFDYAVLVQYSTTIWMKYGHLGRFHGPLAKKMGSTVDDVIEFAWIPVQAGDTLGFIEPRVGGVDLQVVDTTVVLNHVYPEDYNFEAGHSALLTNYYQEPLKSQLINLSMRKSPPYLGKTDYDIPGKLIGNWFMEGNKVIYQNALTIAYNHIFGDRVQIRDGYYQHRSEPDHSRIFSALVKNNHPKPDTIGPEHGMVKFEVITFGHGINFDQESNGAVLVDTTDIDQEAVDGVFLLEMLSPERLKVESFAGKTADQVDGFTGEARIYSRKQ